MPFQYQPRAFSIPNVALPPPVNILGSLADLANLAGYMQQMKTRRGQAADEERTRTQTNALEDALGQSRGDIDQAITILEGQSLWPVAQQLREKKATIQKAQHDALKSSYDAGISRMNSGLKELEYLGRLTAGVESDEAWQQDRPLFVQALGEEQVPTSFDKDWVARTRTRGIDALQLMQEQREALTRLDNLPDDRLKRDELVLTSLRPFIQGADTGEEVEQALEYSYRLYAPTEAVRAKVGPIPPGPLPKDWKTKVLTQLGEEGPTGEAFDRYLAETFGPRPTAAQMAQARRDWATSGRDPNVGAAERRQAKDAQIEQFRQDLSVALTTEGADLATLQPTAKTLGLRWTTEVALAQRAAEDRRRATARDLQLLETVPRNPITGQPMEDPTAAQQRRLTAAGPAVRPPEAPPAPAEATIRERVKGFLRQQGFAETEANVDLFLSKPRNRELLGLSGSISPVAGQP